MNIIGCTLPLSLLSETPPEDLRDLLQIGPPQDQLKCLASLGYAAIEWHAVKADTDPKILRLAEVLCHRLGLLVTFHGTLTLEATPEIFWSPYRNLLGCKANRPYTVTVHGLDTPTHTASVLAALDAYAVCENLPFRLVLENDHRTVGETAAADTLNGVWQCLKGESPRIGICWDIGHYEYNCRTGGEAPPPPDILRRVAHTHLHGITAAGMHQPPDAADSFFADQLLLLRKVGYSGIWNVELSPSRIYRTRSLLEAFDSSYAAVTAVLSGR